MSNIDLGSISTSIELDLSSLSASVASVQTYVTQISTTIQNNFTTIDNSVKVSMANVKSNVMQTMAAFNQIAGLSGQLGSSLERALGGAVKTGADLETSLMSIANNTSLTKNEVVLMTDTVKRLGKESGASFTQLATGFAKITNMGYDAAQAPHILEVAMKAALATGTDVGQTAQILSQTMKTFGFSTGQASGAMNVLVQASKDGNTTLQQFVVGAAGPTLALAGSMNTSLTSVAAAFVTLTRAGFSASEAGTQIKNVLVHLAEPGTAVRKMLEDLSQRSKIDLVSAFTISAQSGKGMGETLEKIREVAHKLGLNAEDLEMKLIHAMRGGLGAMVLSKAGAADYNEEVKKLDATLSGNLDPTTVQYEEQQRSLNAQIAKGRNEMQLMAMSIEKSLQPAIVASLNVIHGLIEGFMHLSQQQQAGLVSVAALTAGFLITVSTIARVITVVNALSVALASLGAVSAGPVALGLLAAAAAAGLLYVAYNKLTESTEQTYEELKKENAEQQKSIDAKVKNAEEAATLSERYDKLSQAAKLSKDQHKELHTILNRLSELAPDLISGYDRQGNALGILEGHARRTANAFYDLSRAQALNRSAALGLEVQHQAEQRSALDEQRKELQATLQRGSRSVTETSGGGYAGAGVYSRTHEESLTPAEKATAAASLRQMDAQIAALDRGRQDLLQQMKTIQAPFAPGHQGADPAGDLRKKELAAKEAELARVKAERDKVAHDAGLPNYHAPGKTKKGKEEKDPDMGDVIADHIKTATKSASVKASCAFFVTEVLKESGVAVKGSNSVKELWKQLIEGGAEEVSSGFKRGDILKFHGRNFGTSKDAEGKGNHTGIYNGDGTFTDSHDYNSRRSTRSLADYMKANPDADVKALRLGDKDDRTSKMVENHNDGLEKQAEKAKDVKEKIAEITDKIYELTHAEDDVKARNFLKEYTENNKVDHQSALTLLIAQMNELKAAREKLNNEQDSASNVGNLEYTVKQRSDRAAEQAASLKVATEKAKAEYAAREQAFADREKDKIAAAKESARIENALMDQRLERVAHMKQSELYTTLDMLNRMQQQHAAYSVEWLRIEKEKQSVQKQLNGDTNKPTQHQEIAANWKAELQTMRANLSGILGGAFQDLFDGKSHQLFDRMLQNFVKMLEQMAAKALAMGIINLLTGGAGGFLGGAANGNKGGGFLGSFGFDDASNDKKAGRFGFDFARHFTGGMADYNNAHKPLQGGAGRSVGDTHINNHFHGMVVREEADIDRISEQIARKVQTGLRNFVGTGS